MPSSSSILKASMEPPQEQSKFLKDPLSIDDIPGTRTKVKRVYEQRDTMNTKDIEGSYRYTNEYINMCKHSKEHKK